MKQSNKFWFCFIVFAGIAVIAFAAGGSSGAEQHPFPTPLQDYNDTQMENLSAILSHRISHTPFNLWGSLVFLMAILHTFFASKITKIANDIEHEHVTSMRKQGKSEHEVEQTTPLKAEALHFFGEVEAIFGIWVIALGAVIIFFYDWSALKNYISHKVNYTEPMFVVVIMALASTRPILRLAEQILGVVAGLGKYSPAAWWFSILTFAPILGSFITEPAAMTIAALLLVKQFYELKPTRRHAYATIGLLFVNVSVGGTFTHFAAPPVLMVAAPWGWTLDFMAIHFGWKAFIGIIISNVLYYMVFRNDFTKLELKTEENGDGSKDWDQRDDPVPIWITVSHILFMGWTVLNAHYPPLFIGGFLFFLGFAEATKLHQNRVNLKPPMLVGFFLAGLVTHGGVQAWWIAPVLGSLGDLPLMIGATILTAFNDNAAITYLSTLVPACPSTTGKCFSMTAKYAVVAGAVTGGGLTVIANAPNPAGQSILNRFFNGGVNPAKLAAGALIPTVILGFCYMAIPTVSESSLKEKTTHSADFKRCGESHAFVPASFLETPDILETTALN